MVSPLFQLIMKFIFQNLSVLTFSRLAADVPNV